MKKIFGLAVIILISGIALNAIAQSRPGAVNSSDKKTVPAAEQADQEQVAQPKSASKPASKPAPAPTTVSKPEPVSKPAPSTGTTAPAPAPKPKTETNSSAAQQTTQPAEGPSRDKRMHAEERSKGHAFSGKGKGGDKNLVDPAAKDKDKKVKAKKAKKAKKTKKIK